MKAIWFLEDHLSTGHGGLKAADKKEDCLLFIEERARGSHLRYHKKRQVLIYSAMRHFAAERKKEGWRVEYHSVREAEDYAGVLDEHLKKIGPDKIQVMEPNNYFEEQALKKIASQSRAKLELLPNRLFLMEREEFVRRAGSSKRLLMENHYRHLRNKLQLLLEENGDPFGGKWNYDQQNRKTFRDWQRAGKPVPEGKAEVEPDKLTREAMRDVDAVFPHHPGETRGFAWPVTSGQSRQWLRQFLRERLQHFGDFQDLMVQEEPTLFHSQLSPMMNLGLLSASDCARAAADSLEESGAPLAAVEAFIRQIIGWREFVRGVYWLKMPDYASVNELGATLPLPEFFYSGETDMNCLRQTIAQVRETGFAHHIQRLMILGNFLLLAGVRPGEALRWFSEMFVDAHDWVMAANVLGMALHADGGFMATKPYAGAGAYISKMSNYCQDCRFRPDVKSGPDACPFNLLYWNFYDRHARRFAGNPRTAMMVRSWMKRDGADRTKIVREAEEFLSR